MLFLLGIRFMGNANTSNTICAQTWAILYLNAVHLLQITVQMKHLTFVFAFLTSIQIACSQTIIRFLSLSLSSIVYRKSPDSIATNWIQHTILLIRWTKFAKSINLIRVFGCKWQTAYVSVLRLIFFCHSQLTICLLGEFFLLPFSINLISSPFFFCIYA